MRSKNWKLPKKKGNKKKSKRKVRICSLLAETNAALTAPQETIVTGLKNCFKVWGFF